MLQNLQKQIDNILNKNNHNDVKARSEEKLQIPLQTFLRQFSTDLDKTLYGGIESLEEGGSAIVFLIVSKNFRKFSWIGKFSKFFCKTLAEPPTLADFIYPYEISCDSVENWWRKVCNGICIFSSDLASMWKFLARLCIGNNSDTLFT